MLRAQGVSHAFDYPLYEDVTLDFLPSTSTAIVGVSGSGKSTFLHTLASFVSPKKGEVFYKNQSLYALKNEDLIEIRRYDFGMIFQHHYLFHGLSAQENLDVSSLLVGEDIDKELIKQFGLSALMALPMGSLSGGQQQRLSIARVLTKKPKVIFADEPTGNLDGQTAHEVMNLLFDYVKKNNAILILVTHDSNLAKLCDNCFEVIDNQLVPRKWN